MKVPELDQRQFQLKPRLEDLLSIGREGSSMQVMEACLKCQSTQGNQLRFTSSMAEYATD